MVKIVLLDRIARIIERLVSLIPDDDAAVQRQIDANTATLRATNDQIAAALAALKL